RSSNWIWEIQMNKVQMFSLSLAAVLAGPVHAQVCSGGNDGGMDATGNQCNTLNEVAASSPGSGITPPTQISKMGSVPASASAARSAIRLVKTSSQDSAPTAMAAPVTKKLHAAPRPSTSLKTAAGQETFCSGGTGAGMDVTGNQC